MQVEIMHNVMHCEPLHEYIMDESRTAKRYEIRFVSAARRSRRYVYPRDGLVRVYLVQ